MWLYIKQLLQLLLEPSHGWEDISEANRAAETIQRTGFFPWIGVTSLSCFARLIYEHDLTFIHVLQTAIAVAGAMFISLYVSRLLLDILLPKYVDAKMNISKINVFNLYMTGMMGLYLIVANLMPASLTFLKFLPLLSLLVIFKSTAFMGVRESDTTSFLFLTALNVIVIPIGVAALLTFII